MIMRFVTYSEITFDLLLKWVLPCASAYCCVFLYSTLARDIAFISLACFFNFCLLICFWVYIKEKMWYDCKCNETTLHIINVLSKQFCISMWIYKHFWKTSILMCWSKCVQENQLFNHLHSILKSEHERARKLREKSHLRESCIVF